MAAPNSDAGARPLEPAPPACDPASIAQRTPLIVLPVLLCLLVLAACGGEDAGDRDSSPADPRAAEPTGADPGAVRVIRSWSDALRGGDVAGASALWAAPSKVQNGTPLLTLRSAAAVRLFNDSLSCGSRLVSAVRAPHGFTIAVFRLTQRPGADCGSGTGNVAHAAIRVRHGKIAEWYRLADDPEDQAAPREPAGPIV